jgi:excisionase family DNA binding protein
MTPETMSLEEAAGYLRLGRDATRALWEAGELPGVSLNQKHLVFRREALNQWLADQEQRQMRERKRASGTAPAANAPAGPRPRGRQRRTLPDLAPYERQAGISSQ